MSVLGRGLQASVETATKLKVFFRGALGVILGTLIAVFTTIVGCRGSGKIRKNQGSSFGAVHTINALLLGVYLEAPDCWKTHLSNCLYEPR